MIAPDPAPLAARADALAREDLHAIHRASDTGMAVLLAAQWVVAIVVALITAPLSWAGPTSTVHPHLWAALGLGGLFTLFPVAIARRFPGTPLSRQCIAVAQTLYSCLLIHLGGGRIEWHFHVFCSLAFLAVYRDWRILQTLTVIIAADHFIRGLWWPASVFGSTTVSSWRWMEHAAWVVAEDLVLTVSVLRAVREVRSSAMARASLEAAKADVERQVAQRTAELDAALVEARSASIAKSAFLANMSHEIRTPMTAILGFSEMLERHDLAHDERCRAMTTIRANGAHLLGVINNILDVSKIEAGRLDLANEPVDVRAVVEHAASTVRARAEDKGVCLSIDLSADLPHRIEGDPIRLAQILTNLADNAVKFTERGSVFIAARPRGVPGTLPEKTCRLEFEVTDTGIGISPEDLARLFQPFSQADTSGTRRFGGTGLGLVIARRLTELIGGTLNVTSQAGLGTRFTVEITARVLDVGHPIVSSPRPPAQSSTLKPAPSPEEPPRLVGRILLAEDGVDNQRLFAYYLRKAGAIVDIVEDGQQAVERVLAADTRPYDLVLMDMQMPVLDGYHATRMLRARGYTGPIVAITAHAMSSDRQACLNAGCDDYESKPISAERLLRAVAPHVRSPNVRAA